MSGSGLRAHVVARRGEDFGLDVELEIAPGATVALLGPNGAGKSTSVDALAGILPLVAGRIELDGRTLDDPAGGLFVPPEQRHVGVVFQQYILFEHLDVLDNIAFGPAVTGRSRREARAVAASLIDIFHLGPLAHLRPGRLSGGQAQQVALARALASEPDLLLLDEPLAALDVSTRANLRRVLASHLADFAGPRLLITHDPADAFLLADRIHVLEGGRITQSGAPVEIRRRPATAYVAALAGLNLLTGTNTAGVLTLDGHDHTLRSADTHTSGPVLITIHPNAIALHGAEPHGSPRNTWATRITTVEPLGEITRVMVGDPVPLCADVTPGAVESLGLRPGGEVWLSIKATEIEVNPA